MLYASRDFTYVWTPASDEIIKRKWNEATMSQISISLRTCEIIIIVAFFSFAPASRNLMNSSSIHVIGMELITLACCVRVVWRATSDCQYIFSTGSEETPTKVSRIINLSGKHRSHCF